MHWAGGPGSSGKPQGEMDELVKKMSDPKTSPEERAKLASQVLELSQQAIEEMQNQANNAGAYAKEAQDDDAKFGFEQIGFAARGVSAEGTVKFASGVGLAVVEKGHEAKVHVKLLMAMEQGEAGIVGEEIDFGFLIAAQHDDIFENASGGFVGETC